VAGSSRLPGPRAGQQPATGRGRRRVLGFGAVLAREGVTYLGDLFIRPDHLGRGLGKALLSSLFAGAGDRTTYASSDPRALTARGC